MHTANRHCHAQCKQGGESITEQKKALDQGQINRENTIVVDSTTHQLKFAEFQRRYFEDTFGPEYQVNPGDDLKNAPVALDSSAAAVANYLRLKKR